jgi:hypothetical protein
MVKSMLVKYQAGESVHLWQEKDQRAFFSYRIYQCTYIHSRTCPRAFTRYRVDWRTFSHYGEEWRLSCICSDIPIMLQVRKRVSLQGRARRQREIHSRAVMLAARHRMEFHNARRKVIPYHTRKWLPYKLVRIVRISFHLTICLLFHVSIWEVFHKADAQFVMRTWESYELSDSLLHTITNDQQLHVAEVLPWLDISLCF